MRRLALAFPSLLLFASGGAAVAACGALKSAEDGTTSTPDGGGDEDPSTPGDTDPSEDPDDAGTRKDARADANDPTARPCTESVCPTDEIAKGLHGPVAVAVNDTHVFWIEVGSTIPNAGNFGQLIRLQKGKTCADRSCFDVVDPFVVDGELEGRVVYDTRIGLGAHDVCHAQSYNGSPTYAISCFSLSTLAKRPLASGSGVAVSLWVGATSARWAIGAYGSPSGQIRGRTLDGGTAQPVAGNRPDPTSVTSDGTATYWTERAQAGAAAGDVDALRSDGGVAVLASGRAGPIAVKAYGQHLYWLEYSSRLVMRVRIDGTGAPEEIADTDPNPFALVVDASGVYWASAGAAQTGTEGSIARAPLTPGGKTTVMMTNLDGAYDLAADDASIFVATVGGALGNGKILRMSKTY